jgi:Protein of unknown function DUF262/Protein of unknown function (DUF1524)
MKITPTSLSVQQLLGSSNEQYVVPAYQRRYSWRTHQVGELWDDIFVLESADIHLLGTIVCLAEAHTAGINRLELVDGQQRLTTISIILYCLRNRLNREGDAEAQEIERLLRARTSKGGAEPKVLLDSLDSKQFERHISGKVIDPSAIENHQLAEAFADVTSWIEEYDLETLRELAYKLRNQALVVRLDVSDAKDAFKLFETINNRGLQLSSTDIIKNFMLGNAARFGNEALAFARDKWAHLIKHLDGISSENFFRQHMSSQLAKPVTQSMVVGAFQASFMTEVQEAQALPDRSIYIDEDEDDDEEDKLIEPLNGLEPDEGGAPPPPAKVSFHEYLTRLVERARIYREIVLGETKKPKLDRRLRNLNLIKAQPSYGFLMTLRAGGCTDKQLEKVLQLTEAFLLRRHICRERTNENERIFARLSGVDPDDPLEVIRKTFREYSPSDEKFRDEFATADFVPSLIPRARYCLEQIEMHLQGEFAELFPGGPDDVHVEHIIPQTIKTKQAKEEFGDWPTYLGPGSIEKHSRYLSRIGNLTIFAGELNISASNNPYSRKKNAYKSSAIKLTSALPEDYSSFRFAQVESRSKKLAVLAPTLWPIP